MSSNKKDLKATLYGLVEKILKRQQVEDVDALEGHEKETYEDWQETIEKEVTTENIADFIREQIVEQSAELRKAVAANKIKDAQRITARLENYDLLLTFIEEPDRSRETLQETLLAIIK